MLSRLTKEEISATFIHALRQSKLIDEDDTALIFYDLSHLDDRIDNLVSLFPRSALHAVAIKANPLIRILKHIKDKGVGFEAATLPELYLAEKSGVSDDKIIFDSPTKTIYEIEHALDLGCHINIDSLGELDRFEEILKKRNYEYNGTIGIRVNPQIGIGRISTTSVAGEYSKFGVPIMEYRKELIEKFKKHGWLTGVHLHIGSQGCPVEMLLEGIKTVLDFVTETNKQLADGEFENRITIFDIGGGLPVSYYNNKVEDYLLYYVTEMRSRFQELFRDEFKLITEFGRHIHANSGWVASRVEYVKRDSKINTAMIHVGADLFLRKCYRPEDWHHEIFVIDSFGNIKQGDDNNDYSIAGPLCFAGDLIEKGIKLPEVEEGDYIIIQDTGAYTLSMWSRYNSRQIPKVIGYYNNGESFEILKDRESLDSIISFWS